MTSTFNLTECFCQQPDRVVAGNYLLCAAFRDRRKASAGSRRLRFSLNCLCRAYARFLPFLKKNSLFLNTRCVTFFARPTDVTLSASPSPLNSSDACTSAWTFNLEESDSLESVSSEMHLLSVFVRFHKRHFYLFLYLQQCGWKVSGVGGLNVQSGSNRVQNDVQAPSEESAGRLNTDMSQQADRFDGAFPLGNLNRHRFSLHTSQCPDSFEG